MNGPVTLLRNHVSRDSTMGAAVFVRAPGRVNLIGEHTDYNEGFVLPCAIDFATYVAAQSRPDGRIVATALDINNTTISFQIERGYQCDPSAPWSNYVRAVTQVLVDRGHAIHGASLAITGDIPQGSGLSSSASLCVAITKALDYLFTLQLSALEIAQIAQVAENEYVGCHCGIMDQVASVMGLESKAVLLDCRSLSVTPIQIPSEIGIAIVHSGITRGLVGTEYNMRRSSCVRASLTMGVSTLRDASLSQLNAYKAKLDECAYKCARHVITENSRVLAFVDALKIDARSELAKIMKASHNSMRDDFEITTPAIDLLVELIQIALGPECGVRMTGGGFGGCVVAFGDKTTLINQIPNVLSEYQRHTQLRPNLYLCTPQAGASLLDTARVAI